MFVDGDGLDWLFGNVCVFYGYVCIVVLVCCYYELWFVVLFCFEGCLLESGFFDGKGLLCEFDCCVCVFGEVWFWECVCFVIIGEG